MCKVKNCGRAAYTRGLCGFHALQGYYQTEVVPGEGLTAVRISRRPRILPRVRRRPGARPAPEGPKR